MKHSALRILLPVGASLAVVLGLTACESHPSSAETEPSVVSDTAEPASDTTPETDTESEAASETMPETILETETETEVQTLPETEPETVIPSLSTDKTVYEVDEDILITATGNPDDRVAFFPADADVTVGTPIYYAHFAGDTAIPSGKAVCLTTLSGQNRKATEVAFYYGVLPVGDYRLVLTSPTGEVLAECTLTIQFTKDKITTGAELAAKCLDVVLHYKTLYVNGCFGAPMTDANKPRYLQNTAYNRQPERQALINAASPDTFGFDCVCLIKGLLWGWDGDTDHVYGGASYVSNGVPDITEEAMLEGSRDISANFREIEVGEVVWIQGHIGVYIGNGLAVECTPAWEDCVQITACNTRRTGYNSRNWSKHGQLPYLTYTGEDENVRETNP